MECRAGMESLGVGPGIVQTSRRSRVLVAVGLNAVVVDSRRACGALRGDGCVSWEWSKGVKPGGGVRLESLVKDARDGGEVRTRFAAWRDGASAWKTGEDGGDSSAEVSGNGLQLRRFLEGYEGWQGEKAPRISNKVIGRKKKRRHGEKMLAMLKALEETGDIDEALGPWKGLLGENEQGMLLNDQWRCDRALELFKWFNEQESYRPNTCHYTIMLRKCGRAQKWDLVRNLLSEMQAKYVELNSYTYNTLIDVNEKAGRKAEATFWFECSKREGFVDEVAIGSQMNVFKEFGDFEEGNRLYESLPGILSQKNFSSGDEIHSCIFLYIVSHCRTLCPRWFNLCCRITRCPLSRTFYQVYSSSVCEG